MSSTSLSCSAICVRFGAFTAVHDLTVNFASDLCHAVIGPNGAGKTTLLNVLSGRFRPTSGNVRLGDIDITHRLPHERALLGIGRSFQITQMFGQMTVLENLRLAAQAATFRRQPLLRPVSSFAELTATVDEMIEFIGLQDKRDILAERLSHGDQRALDLALACVVRPKVLLLDEPLAGVGHSELDAAVKRLSSVIKDRTVILIEHNIEAINQLAETITVMVRGSVLASGRPDEVRNSPEVREAYLGKQNVVA